MLLHLKSTLTLNQGQTRHGNQHDDVSVSQLTSAIKYKSYCVFLTARHFLTEIREKSSTTRLYEKERFAFANFAKTEEIIEIKQLHCSLPEHFISTFESFIKKISPLIQTSPVRLELVLKYCLSLPSVFIILMTLTSVWCDVLRMTGMTVWGVWLAEAVELGGKIIMQAMRMRQQTEKTETMMVTMVWSCWFFSAW